MDKLLILFLTSAIAGCAMEETPEKIIKNPAQFEKTETAQGTYSPTILLKSDFQGSDLIKGMDKQSAIKNLTGMGWQRMKPLIKGADTTHLWMTAPCRAAAFDSSSSYIRASIERPPKYYQLRADFYECNNEDVKNLGQLNKITIREIDFITYTKYR